MSVYFAIENGQLVRRLFVGPIQVIEPQPKSTIAKMLPDYENVAETTLVVNNIKEQQQAIAKIGDSAETNTNTISMKRPKVIRRRRKFIYSQADEFLATHGYWNSEKRSLTRYHSNSLMYEYSRVK